MKAFRITDIKDFTNKLFIGDIFDQFLLNQAAFTTYASFSIDGRLQYDFYDTDEKDVIAESGRYFSFWKEIKPYCFSIIRGKRAPLQFKIILQASPKSTAIILKSHNLTIPAEQLTFFINLQYKNKTLLCTTGSSSANFFTEKTAEHAWESTISAFFSKHQIQYEDI